MRTKEEILDGMELPDFLFRCMNDFKFFCERMLGLTEYGGVHDFQMEWFYLIHNYNRVMIQAPSGFSKTTIVGVSYPLWVMWNYNNKKILLISKTLSQSKDNMLMQIRSYIEDNEFLRELIPTDAERTWNQTQIRTSNRCSVIMRPYSINIKSYRGDIIICDEIDSYEDTDIYFDYVVSRVNPGGKIIGISTPDLVSRLMDLIRYRDKGREYKFKRYTAIIDCKIEGDLSSGRSIWEERFTMEYLMKLRDEQGEQFFQKNYMCNAEAESEDSIFSMKRLVSGFDETRKFTYESLGGTTVIGCDFAYASGPKADFDAFISVEKKDNLFFIKHMEKHKGIKTTIKASRIEELNTLHTPIINVCDESNIGPTVIDELRARALPIKPKKFSPAERNKLLMDLGNIIDSGKLIIPRNPDDINAVKLTNELITQLLGFKYRKSPVTGIKTIVSTATHDDLAMALAMAVQELAVQVTGDFFAELGELEKKKS